ARRRVRSGEPAAPRWKTARRRACRDSNRGPGAPAAPRGRPRPRTPRARAPGASRLPRGRARARAGSGARAASRPAATRSSREREVGAGSRRLERESLEPRALGVRGRGEELEVGREPGVRDDRVGGVALPRLEAHLPPPALAADLRHAAPERELDPVLAREPL